MYKVTSKIRFAVLLRGGGGFMKNVAVTFSVPKSIYEWPLIAISILLVFKINFWENFANVFVEENYSSGKVSAARQNVI